MNKVDLSKEEILLTENHSSKGNQNKWKSGEMWYKADHMGYEALAEVVISSLLSKTSVTDFVVYEPVMIKYNGKEISGCMSKSFINSDEEIITFERLHRSYNGIGLAKEIAGIADLSEKIKYTADFISDITGLTNAGEYITILAETDAFFLNEDRHTNNLAIIRDMHTMKYRFAPVFDNGLSLLSDINDYPVDEDVYECISRVEAKPFCRSFDDQADEAVRIYGAQLDIKFRRSDAVECIDKLEEYYPHNILKRAEKVLLEQMRKYTVL